MPMYSVQSRWCTINVQMGRRETVDYKLKVVRARNDGMSFGAIVRKFRVAKSTAILWCKKHAEGGFQALLNRHGGGAQRKLSRQFCRDVVAKWLKKRNRRHLPATYTLLARHLRRKHHILISTKLLQSYGYEMGYRRRRVIAGNRKAPNKSEFHLERTSALFVEYLLSNFDVNHLIFMDEKCVYSNAVPYYTLFKGDGKPYIDPGVPVLNCERYDLVHACSATGLFGKPLIYTPGDRVANGSKGITAVMFERDYIESIIIPAINACNHRCVIVMDNARIHREQKLEELFAKKCNGNFGGLLFIPPYTAKFSSPLDNGYHSSLDHHYRQALSQKKHRCEKDVLEAIDEAYARANNSFDKYYRHCGLF